MANTTTATVTPDTASTTAPAPITVPHVKFTLTAKGLLQYELTLTYTSVKDLMDHAIADAFAFDCNARAVLLNLVPRATPSTPAD